MVESIVVFPGNALKGKSPTKADDLNQMIPDTANNEHGPVVR